MTTRPLARDPREIDGETLRSPGDATANRLDRRARGTREREIYVEEVPRLNDRPRAAADPWIALTHA